MCCKTLKSVICVKDTGDNVAFSLKVFQQFIDVAIKENMMLGFNKFMNKDLVLQQYNRTVRQHLEYSVKFWCPYHTKDITKIGVQGRAFNMIQSF